MSSQPNTGEGSSRCGGATGLTKYLIILEPRERAKDLGDDAPVVVNGVRRGTGVARQQNTLDNPEAVHHSTSGWRHFALTHWLTVFGGLGVKGCGRRSKTNQYFRRDGCLKTCGKKTKLEQP